MIREFTINIDVLLHSGKELSSKVPDIHSIDTYKPPAEIIERCRRFLLSQGLDCYATDFGLACSSSKLVIEKLFQTELTQEYLEDGRVQWKFLKEPVFPEQIRLYIRQLTISAPPEFFA